MIEYVDINTFESLAGEVNLLKHDLSKLLNSDNDDVILSKLRDENKILSIRLQEKESLIKTLTDLIENNFYSQTVTNDNAVKRDEFKWELVSNKKDTFNNARSNQNTNDYYNVLPLQNRYTGMSIDPEVLNNDSISTNIRSHSNYKTAYESNSIRKRPANIINKFAENDLLIQHKKKVVERTYPGNSTYSDIIRQGEKICIIGDSICRPIDMVKFEECLDKGTSRKRYIRGATVSQLSLYAEAVLKEDIPDKVILSMGTNNLTKKSQSEMETAKEIIDIVHKCYNNGVNDVLVSSITIRPRFKDKINLINKILERNAAAHNYEFIDNNNIMEKHLWEDHLHLNDKGITLLSNNFLKALNKRSVFDNFY